MIRTHSLCQQQHELEEKEINGMAASVVIECLGHSIRSEQDMDFKRDIRNHIPSTVGFLFPSLITRILNIRLYSNSALFLSNILEPYCQSNTWQNLVPISSGFKIESLLPQTTECFPAVRSSYGGNESSKRPYTFQHYTASFYSDHQKRFAILFVPYYVPRESG